MDPQPPLHDLVVCLRAPTAALGGRDGQIRAGGVQGLFHADVRALSQALLLVGGEEPEPLVGYAEGPGRSAFVGIARRVGDPDADPTVRVTRRRESLTDGLVEEIELRSTARDTVDTEVRLDVASDLADMQVVKRGAETAAVPPTPIDGGLSWQASDAAGAVRVRLTGERAVVDGAALRWAVRLPSRETVVLRWRVRIADAERVVVPARGDVRWERPAVRADDGRLAALLDQSLADLDTLRLATTARPDDTFLAAGAPWFLTLFGRDSLWAARMLLPLGTDLAASTLRTLAGRQGTRHDRETGEAPGKIMHELRRGSVALDEHGGTVLPPLYYGTVDATMLWMTLLHDAWRWGLPDTAVEPLLPHLEAAADWLTTWADPDGDGFVEYVDESGHGLANQGWKDSRDAMRFRDGRVAEGPIALVEVQGYAHEAAVDAAALLDAFGRPGADPLRAYAARLATAFRERFWVEDEHGRYPALALDGAKRAVDAMSSNIGHLLGTGLLDAGEVADVARRLVAADMSSGYGLRTMSAAAAGYSPLSYHCGSVWPHDTAVVAAGLMREGRADEAAVLARGLLDAAPAFEYRLPELFAGDAADAGRPVPYPAACRPQAWAAASAVTLLQVLLGIGPDVPAGRLRVEPIAPGPVGALRVEGLTVGVERLAVQVDREGTLVAVTGSSLAVLGPGGSATPPREAAGPPPAR